MSADDYRHLVWRCYRQGADRTFLLSIWTIGCAKNLLGDNKSLAKWSYFEDAMNLPRQEILLR